MYGRGKLQGQEGLVSVPLRTTGWGAAPGGREPDQAEVVDYRPYPEHELRQLTTNVRNLERCRVVGDSMEPTFRDGDEVLVDFTAPDPYSLHDGVYAIRLAGALMIKRLVVQPAGVVDIRSDNPAYPPRTFNVADQGEDFAILGRVRQGLRRF